MKGKVKLTTSAKHSAAMGTHLEAASHSCHHWSRLVLETPSLSGRWTSPGPSGTEAQTGHSHLAQQSWAGHCSTWAPTALLCRLRRRTYQYLERLIYKIAEYGSVHELLTYCSIWVQGFVLEAENFSQVVEIRMLRYEVPLRVVHPVVEVVHRDLDPPVILVVNLDMPMHSYWAHMRGAFHQRCQAACALPIHHRIQIRRIASVKEDTQLSHNWTKKIWFLFF